MKFVAILAIFSMLIENSFGQEEKTKEQRKAEKETRQKEKERTEFNHFSKIIFTWRLQVFKIVVSKFLYCFLNFEFLIWYRHF